MNTALYAGQIEALHELAASTDAQVSVVSARPLEDLAAMSPSSRRVMQIPVVVTGPSPETIRELALAAPKTAGSRPSLYARSQICTDEQFDALLEAARANRSSALRTELVLRLARDCGVRLSESVALSLADVSLEAGTLSISRPLRGGAYASLREPQVVELNDQVAGVLRAWMEARAADPAGRKSERLLVNDDGLPMTAERVRTIVHRCATQAGLAGKIGYVQLRAAWLDDRLREPSSRAGRTT